MPGEPNEGAIAYPKEPVDPLRRGDQQENDKEATEGTIRFGAVGAAEVRGAENRKRAPDALHSRAHPRPCFAPALDPFRTMRQNRHVLSTTSTHPHAHPAIHRLPHMRPAVLF
eukprot:scaffold1077_cov96-Isochrysis_galbana.AAC.1